MSQLNPPQQSRMNWISFLWSLVLTKCFLLEFSVRHYEVPINSLTYVWLLSIGMASVATIVHANSNRDVVSQNFRHTDFRIDGITLSASAILILWSLASREAPVELLLVLATLLFAFENLRPRSTGSQTLGRFKMMAWLLVSGGVLVFGSPLAFLLIATHLFVFAMITLFLRVQPSKGSTRNPSFSEN